MAEKIENKVGKVAKRFKICLVYVRHFCVTHGVIREASQYYVRKIPNMDMIVFVPNQNNSSKSF